MNLADRIALMARLGNYLLQKDNETLDKKKLEAYEKNQWFTRQFVDYALHQIATQYLDTNKLQQWTQHYHLDDNIVPRKVGLVMAGNIPLVGFHDFLSVFISGHHLYIKMSEKDNVLLDHIIDVLQQWEPTLRHVIYRPELLKGCDAYIATGSNNSSRYFHHYFGRYPSIIRSNKTSVAILSGDETNEELEALADDIHIYFGLGCRNVTKLWVPEGYDFVPLLEALKKKYEHFSDHTKYRNNYDYCLALLIMNNKYYMTNGVMILVEDPSNFSPVSELHYSYYKAGDDPAKIVDLSQDIQCTVGRRSVPFGQSQNPSLNDYADGVDTMEFLLGL